MLLRKGNPDCVQYQVGISETSALMIKPNKAKVNKLKETQAYFIICTTFSCSVVSRCQVVVFFFLQRSNCICRTGWQLINMPDRHQMSVSHSFATLNFTTVTHQLRLLALITICCLYEKVTGRDNWIEQLFGFFFFFLFSTFEYGATQCLGLSTFLIKSQSLCKSPCWFLCNFLQGSSAICK